MKILFLLSAFLFAKVCYPQINVINTGTSDDLLNISVIENNILVSGFSNYLVKSYDQCTTMMPLSTANFTTANLSFTSINRLDTNTIYITASDAVGRGTIWKSINGGNSWAIKFDSMDVNYDLQTTKFFDKYSGITISSHGRSILTSNGMSSYEFDSVPITYPRCAQVDGDSTVIVGDGLGGQAMSKDQGHTWLSVGPQYGNPAPSDFAFLHRDTIFGVTTFGSSTFTSLFLRSFDRGLNWDYKIFYGHPAYIHPPNLTFSKICIKDKKAIFMLAKDDSSGYGVLSKSIDLGETWSQFFTPFKKILFDMKFINDSIALICGEQGLLFKWNSKAAVFTEIKKNELPELQVSIFPNPVQERLQIDVGRNPDLFEVRVYNVLGQLVDDQKINGSHEISTLNLPTGLYSLKIRSDKAEKVFKLMKD